MDEATLIQLLDESCKVAEEEGATATLDEFVAFINDMLPLDVIQELESINGGADYLRDIWSERYDPSNAEPEEEEDDGACQVCERMVRRTRHHVFPREVHKALKKKGYDAKLLSTTIAICRMCHSTIHRLFTNEQLAESYYTVELLLEDERFLKYAKWASNLADHRYLH